MRNNEITAGCLLLVVIVLCLVLGVFTYAKLSTYHVTAQVAGLQWRRVIRVERYQAVREDSLRSSVPADAYAIEYYTHSWYESEVCSAGKGKTYECGHWESESRAKYTVNRWRYDHDLSTQGSPQDERVWPAFTPSEREELGALREGSREEFLTVALSAGDQQFSYRAPDVDVWRSFSSGQAYGLEVNRLNEPQWDTLKLDDKR